MARIESTVTIARARADVFGCFLALDENVPRTNPDVQSVVKIPEGPTRAGTTFRFRGKVLGRVRETTTRFHRGTWTHDLPAARLALFAMGGPGGLVAEFDYVRVSRPAR